jgi:N-acetylglucosaminyl-diphospho-decaprenol L-rhamnosyltransferase
VTASVTVVIVNFNAGGPARRCLASAAADLGSHSWEAIVVDNASDDPESADLESLPGTRVIRNATNRGFGAAVNQAAQVTASPLLWLLNPDCAVVPGAFDTLRRELDVHPECAIAAPQLLEPDGRLQASARGEPTAWTGLFGRNTWLTRYFPTSRVVRRNLPAGDLVAAGGESAPVDWVMGAAMLVRRSAFDAVGGFDERFFLYWEDADLCRRLRDRGYAVRYVPAARVAHVGGASARADSALATRAFHRSAYLYYATHVVPTPWHPLRLAARVALSLRAAWRVRRGK